MFAPIRFVMTTVGLILIGLTTATFVFSQQAETFARARVERLLEDMYDAPVTVGAVNVAPLELGLVAEDVTIHNPEGYTPGPALEISRVVLRPDLKTLFSERPAFDEVVVQHLEVTPQGLGKNIGQLAENAQRAREMGIVPDVAVRRLVLAESGKVNTVVPISLRPFEVKAGNGDETVDVSGDDLEVLKNLGLDVASLWGLLPFFQADARP